MQKDAITQLYFSGKVVVDTSAMPEFAGLAKDAKDIAHLAGAPDGSVVTVKPGAFGEGTISLVTRSALFEWDSECIIYRDADGLKLMLRNEGLFLKPEHQGQGIGTRSSAIQATAAARLGFDTIVTDALAGSFNGYVTWPRMGFDAALPDDLRALLPAGLRDAGTVLDLIESEAGRTWWKDQKRELRMTFDLTPGSRSWHVLRAYLSEKGVRL